MPLAGKAVLWHVVHRLKKCQTLDDIVIATSTRSMDDPLETFACEEGVNLFRGSEENVLERYYLASEQFKADIIVRVTGDAPFVDHLTIDRLIRHMVETGVDYCYGVAAGPTIHEGFDPLTFRALEKLKREVGDDPVAKEHVTAYFKKIPDFVSTGTIALESSCQFKGARMSVDTPNDMAFLEEIYKRLNVPAGEADVCDVVRLLKAHPELLKINGNVRQKDVAKKSLTALFRCDGNEEIGLGHLYRCLALADELREQHGVGVSFAMSHGPVGFELIEKAQYTVAQKHDGEDEAAWFKCLVEADVPDLIVIDVRTGLSKKSVQGLKATGTTIVAIDDGSERRLASDMVFYPPVPQVERFDWTAFSGDKYVGWEWTVIRSRFARQLQSVANENPTVLVTMGGSDPAGMTEKAMAALNLLKGAFTTVVVLGPSFTRTKEVEAYALSMNRQFEIQKNVDDIKAVMARSDLAVASFGVTAYELAALGVPAIYLCLTKDHAESASAFVKEGMAVSLGVHDDVSVEGLAEKVRELLGDKEKRTVISQKAASMVDGLGARRIAEAMVKRIEAPNG